MACMILKLIIGKAIVLAVQVVPSETPRGEKNARTIKVVGRAKMKNMKYKVKSIVVWQLTEAGVVVLRDARGDKPTHLPGRQH